MSSCHYNEFTNVVTAKIALHLNMSSKISDINSNNTLFNTRMLLFQVQSEF